MNEQERREEYNAQRREDERYCKHGHEVCEPCAYDRGVAEERERCAKIAGAEEPAADLDGCSCGKTIAGKIRKTSD